MYLIPTPKFLREESQVLSLRTISPDTSLSDPRLIKAMNKLPLSDDGIPLAVAGETGTGEGYRLRIERSGITLDADGAPGIFYGIQTLRQIFSHDEIPCLYIEDKPDCRHRGFYHDVTRGKVPKVGTLKKLIDDLAYYKQNSLQLYVEHSYEFKEFEGIVGKECCLSAEEIREIDDYCYENFIDFIPSIATCGHLYELLQQERYAHLRVIDNYRPMHVFWYERMMHHTIDPLNSESFELVKSLIDQYIPLFRSEYFNICGDEPWDLINGKYKDMEPDKMYVSFMKKIIEYIKSKGKKVMMWADPEILENLKTAKEVPDDVVLLSWGYGADTPEERVQNLEGLNNPRILCPGTSSWFRLVEKADVAQQNISRMASFCKEYGADGILNTNWGDYGNPCSIELSMHGLMVGAQKSWNLDASVGDDFRFAANHLCYKNPKAAEYLLTLSYLGKGAEYAVFVRHYSNLFYDGKTDFDVLPTEAMLRETQEGCREFISELSSEKWTEEEFRLEMLTAAEGIAVTAELFAKSIGYKLDRWTDTEHWLKTYRRQWLKKNKESELEKIEELYRTMESVQFDLQ